MQDTRNRDKSKNSNRAGPELGVVRIQSSPTPDSQDRLRRLFTLLVKYATRDGNTPPGRKSPLEDGSAKER